MIRRNRLSPFDATRKPVAQGRIDWSSRLANALSFFVNHGVNGGQDIDLVRGAAVKHTANCSSNPTAAGQGTRYNRCTQGGGTIVLFPYPATTSSNGTGGGDFTLATQFVVNTLTWPSNQNIFGQTDPAFDDVGVYLDASGHPAGFRNGTTIVASSALAAGQVACLVLTRVGSTLTLYVDGVSVGTGSVSSAISGSGSQAYFGVYNSSGNSDAPDVTCLWSGAWNRALSQQEALELTKRPYQLLTSWLPVARPVSVVAATFNPAWAARSNIAFTGSPA